MKKIWRRDKIIIFFLIVLVLSIFMSGCQKGEEQSSIEENVDEGIEVDMEENLGVVIEDHLGREVFLPENPTRILALTRAYMEELFELGITPIGKVEEYKNRPEGVALPSVSNQETPDLEAIYQLEPDFIIANTRQHSNVLENLEATGATVFFVDPNRIEEDPLTDRILLFGSLFGKQQVAEDYVQQLDELSVQLQDKVKEYGYETALILQGGVESIQAAQPTGLYGALLMRLGMKNIVPEGLPGSDKSTWVNFDIETILLEDPDVILIRAAGSKEQEPENLLDYYKEEAQWQQLKAVKEGKLFILPAKVNPGNISNEEALKTTAKAICPD
ncbi:ABC-type Fe3+-hydroxamate transport system, periplasmic component [Clostridium aceticum]|uniref:ABC-type Fe3+-hydroxamate transport system, periplasmic component n=1 Tax=Clostridium aceticum TaxID=84022 RepID=A0A0D8I9J9_9CLOT|nr:ABC transporter substrate-binding protein [Clostridium aceticum]AKL96380.1 ABC-type Fe3+-hydroxamate transport system, periplasmic component [Clostridium aceticum]KJF26960.1 hypothetical protein TZ02_10555 [Clostridium aceticum]